MDQITIRSDRKTDYTFNYKGEDVVLGAGNHIINSKIGRNSKLMHCVIKNSFIKEGSTLEPFGFIDKGFEKK